MKNLLFMITILTPIFVKAQNNIITIPKGNGQYMYESINDMDSTYKKELLYFNAKHAFIGLFKDANTVIKMDDKEHGRIIGKGFTTFLQSRTLVMESYQQKVYFTLDIAVKNGKYRVQIYDIDPQMETKSTNKYGYSTWTSTTIEEIEAGTVKGIQKRFMKEYLLLLDKEMQSTIAYVNAEMEKKDKAVVSDDF